MTRHLPLVLAAGATALVLTLPAQADPPSITAKRDEAARVLAELHALDDRLEESVEAYNLARIKLAATTRALKTNRHHLGVASRNLTSAQQRVAARLVYLYTTEEPDSSLAVILGSSSLEEVLDRLDTVERVAGQDEVVLSQVRRFKESVLHQRQALTRERAERSRLTAELASQRAAIEAQLGERQRLLASIKDEIATLKAREQARQAELRRQAEARLAAEPAAVDVRATSPPEDDPEVDLGVAAVTPEGVAVAPDTKHGHVVPIAMQYLGVPYLWGDASPSTASTARASSCTSTSRSASRSPTTQRCSISTACPSRRQTSSPVTSSSSTTSATTGSTSAAGSSSRRRRPATSSRSSLSEPWYAAGYVGARRLP